MGKLIFSETALIFFNLSESAVFTADYFGLQPGTEYTSEIGEKFLKGFLK